MSQRGRRAGYVVALGIVCTAAFLLWLGQSSSHVTDSGSSDSVAATVDEEVSRPEPLMLPAALMSSVKPIEPPPEPFSPPPAETPVKAELPHVERDGKTSRLYLSEEYLAQKWAHVPTEELEREMDRLSKEVPRLMEAGTNSFFDSGLAESKVIPRPENTDQALIPTNEHSTGLVATQRTHVLDNGQLLVSSGELPWHANVELYDTLDEKRWLIVELRRRARQIAANGENSSGPVK